MKKNACVIRKKSSLLALFSLFILCTPAVVYAADEEWTLTFHAHLTLNQSGVTVTILADGKAAVAIDDQDVLTGQGTFSVSEKVASPGVVGNAQGKGPFSVKGKRDGKNIIFSFGGPAVPVTGTFDEKVDPSLFAAVETVIERKEGATSSTKHSLAAVQGGIEYRLAGGTNILQETPVSTDLFPAVPNIWILELEGAWTTKGPDGSEPVTLKASVNFPLPKRDGPAKGEGPLLLKVGKKVEAKGTFILDGKIENDVLTFVPKSIFSQSEAASSGGIASSDFGAGIWAFKGAPNVTLPVKNGSEVVENVSHAPSQTSGTLTWRLTGKKIEKWEVTIDNYETSYIIITGGGTKPKNAGLKVHVRRTITVTIENDQFKSAQGAAAFISATPFSEPSWAYDVTSVSAPYTYLGKTASSKTTQTTPFAHPAAFSAKGVKNGSKLDLTCPEESVYVVRIHVTVDYKSIQDHGYTVSEYDLKKGLKERELTNIEVLPFQISVTLVDGWSYDDAPKDAVSRMVITVKRIE